MERVLSNQVGYLTTGSRSMMLLLTVAVGNSINSPKIHFTYQRDVPLAFKVVCNKNIILYTCIMYIA